MFLHNIKLISQVGTFKVTAVWGDQEETEAKTKPLAEVKERVEN